MMAYDSQFVICVLHNGHPVREINGTVSVPFSSEYQIRLKNKHSYLRAKARVWVDGRKASNLGDFILKAGETLDLERFLDNDLDSGNKFKFVPLSDRRVNDPTDPSNGIIKVEFYREQEPDNDWKFTINPKPWKPVKPQTPRKDDDFSWQYTPTVFTNSGRRSSCGPTTSETLCNVSVNYISNSFVDTSAGATVEGSHSEQSFVYGDSFQTDTYPTTLTLKLKGISKPEPLECQVWEKGDSTTRRKKKVRFCSHCARRRSRMAYRFCSRCGNSY